MNELLQLSLLSSLQICFIHILFWDGMLLAWIRRIIDNWVAAIYKMEDTELYFLFCIVLILFAGFVKWISKPLYSCVICMTSIWGILLWHFEWNHSISLLTFLFTVGGINVLLSGLISRAEDFNGEQFVNQKHDAE